MCKYDDPGVSESTTPSFVFVYGSVYMRICICVTTYRTDGLSSWHLLNMLHNDETILFFQNLTRKSFFTTVTSSKTHFYHLCFANKLNTLVIKRSSSPPERINWFPGDLTWSSSKKQLVSRCYNLVNCDSDYNWFAFWKLEKGDYEIFAFCFCFSW